MDENNIIVVTGMPRSGTTMMMRMLEAGGVPLYYDTSRPLEFRENGTDYLNYNIIFRETDRVKGLKEGDNLWLSDCAGKAVKIFTLINGDIPKGYSYKFIYMDRTIKHMVESIKKCTIRMGQKITMPPEDFFIDHIRGVRGKTLRMLRSYPDSDLVTIKFDKTLKKPKSVAIRIQQFLGMDLDIDKMVAVVFKRPAYCWPTMLEERIYAS